MRDGLCVAAQGGVRAAHARMGITVTCAGYGHVHGKDQRAAASGLRPFQRIAHKATVFEHIQLKPHGPFQARSHFLDRADRHAGHGKGNAVCIGRLREDTLFDYKFACMSHNTLRGAAGGGVLLAELLAAKGYFD